MEICYKANDGTIFDDKEDCAKYEEQKALYWQYITKVYNSLGEEIETNDWLNIFAFECKKMPESIAMQLESDLSGHNINRMTAIDGPGFYQCDEMTGIFFKVKDWVRQV